MLSSSRCNTVSQPLHTMNFVAAMVQGHPYWQKWKTWQQFMKKTVFLLLSKCQPWDAVQMSALFSYVEKCEEVLKCIEMKVRLIISGSVLHAIDVTEHTLQMSFLYNGVFMHQLHTPQRALNSQMNMKREQLRYLYTQVIRKQQSSSLWIDIGFDWNLGSFPSWRSDDLMKG